MAWQEEDRIFLSSAADELDEYLASTVYEWPLRSSRISLTPGRVLLSLARCSVQAMPDSSFVIQMDSIRRTIQSNKIRWQKKMTIEYPRRLMVWENMIHDYYEEGLDQSYSAQVTHRVILKLLERESVPVEVKQVNRLEAVDEITKRIITVGEFIWDSQLQIAFDETDYWFLYCKI